MLYDIIYVWNLKKPNSQKWRGKWWYQWLGDWRKGKVMIKGCVCESRSVVSDSLRPHGLQPTRLLSPWDSPGKNTGVGCHALLQGIFLTQGSNPLHADSLLSAPPEMFIKGYILGITNKFLGSNIQHAYYSPYYCALYFKVPMKVHLKCCHHKMKQ